MNLLGMKKAIITWAPRPEMPHPATELAAEKPMLVEVRPPLKRLSDSLALAPKPKLKPTLSEGSSRSLPPVHKGPLLSQGQARANEVTAKLEEVKRREDEALKKVKPLEKELQHPGLEVEEDPYATLLEDDNVPMEAEVPIDDSDPTAM
ncbi:hypothetical protein BHM03_00043013 [Ensete ventricosum]|nr:hypothetical protein BHM03_00043013 [Ensete ventricosum]